MARYEFKLPDIGEGIAEAEIVAWHIKVGDQVKEDKQLADMMTDKATVEMESPVAGTEVKLAGEVGDQIPIGSVLVVFETEGGTASEQDGTETRNGERTDDVALADGLVDPTPAQQQAMPSTAERSYVDRRQTEDRRAIPRFEPNRREGEDDRRSDERRGEDARRGAPRENESDRRQAERRAPAGGADASFVPREVEGR